MNKSFLNWDTDIYDITKDLLPLFKSFKKSNLNEQTFVEPFFGSGSIFLNIDIFDNFIFNSMNVNIFMLINQIKINSNLFISDCKKLFNQNSKNENYFNNTIKEYKATNDYYEKCQKFLFLNQYGIHSQGNVFTGFENEENDLLFFHSRKKNYFPEKEIILMSQKLNEKKNQIFNHYFERVFENLEYGDVVYCNPPKKENEFNQEEHKLLNDLSFKCSLQGSMVIVSCDYNDLNKELYKDCAEYYIKKVKNYSKKIENTKKYEMIAIYA